jgi:hypothetical protein
MIEMLSILIVSFLATSIGIGLSNTTTKAQENALMTKTNARLNFKLAENRADADYKAAISDCRAKPSLDKRRCLDDAKNLNARLIVAAREKMDKALTVVSVPEESAGRK